MRVQFHWILHHMVLELLVQVFPLEMLLKKMIGLLYRLSEKLFLLKREVMLRLMLRLI